jgi:tRNA (guanine-N7-)-methyltransferase
MGRRALRKIDPSLDLSQHLFPLEQVPRPCTGRAFFGSAALLEVEAGSGKGLFLAQAAQKNPHRNYVGIELAARYARFAAARLAKADIANARVVHGDAARFFREWLPDASVGAVHVYFPDPWWKKRHHKRRLMSEPFVRDVARVLVGGGLLHFWTDVGEYFAETIKLLASISQLSGPTDVAEHPAEHDLDYRTHFERRMRLGNRPVFRAVFVRVAERRAS